MTTQTASAFALPAGQQLAELGIVRAARGMVVKMRESYASYRRERDIDTIVDTLHRLNDRQLAALGLDRDAVYGFAAERVHALHDRIAPEAEAKTAQLSLPRREA